MRKTRGVGDEADFVRWLTSVRSVTDRHIVIVKNPSFVRHYKLRGDLFLLAAGPPDGSGIIKP